MLIEDNAGDVLLVREALAASAVSSNLVVRSDGEMAIRFIDELERQNEPCPDLVILDLNLPKRTGTEVLRRIRESARWKSVPIVILTSSNSPRDRQETVDLGASLYIHKPSGLQEFLDIGVELKNLLPRH